MVAEYSKPMLDVGNPRVFNVNVLTRQLLAQQPQATPFFRLRQLNSLLLIKDTVSDSNERSGRAIGTKLYFPFNEADIYEGGRTIFRHDTHLTRALEDMFGKDALPADALADDLRKLAILDKLPSLDPFLLRDSFLNEGVVINESYFEVGEDLWRQIQAFILVRFEAVVTAAFPDEAATDEKARQLIEKIWEARDLEALRPLVDALRLPPEEALAIFAAWKGINFYSFQYDRAKPLFVQLLTWIRDMKLPLATTITERDEMKAMIEQIKAQLKIEWQKVDSILQNYQSAYDKMFKTKTSSSEFVAFLKGSSKTYWELGNSIGKIGHASYCWDMMTKRYPERKLPAEALREILTLLARIFKPEKKLTSAVAW